MKTRTIVVSRAEVGRPVGLVLKQHLGLTWSQVRRLIEGRRVRQGPGLCKDAQVRVRLGQKVRVRLEEGAPDAQSPARRTSPPGPLPETGRGRRGTKAANRPSSPPSPPSPLRGGGPGGRGDGISLPFADRHLVVADKPAGLTTMRHAHEAAEFGRGKRFLPKTLADLLPDLLAAAGKGGGRVVAVHRLDRDTSGLVVFARTPAAAKHLGAQFRGHTIERTYLALVRGRAKSERIESNLVADRGDGRRGSGEGEGQRAITHVRVLEPLGDFTLVECRLETGRTHQVRIHLGERGTPICGETVYDRAVHGAPVPDTSGAPRLCLHAATLAVDHPVSGERLHWRSALPGDMKQVLKRLRAGVKE